MLLYNAHVHSNAGFHFICSPFSFISISDDCAHLYPGGHGFNSAVVMAFDMI